MVGPELRRPCPNPTSTGRATPAWDSNPLDPAQAIEIMDIPTTYARRSPWRLPAPNEDRTPQLQAVEELALMRSDWLGVRDDFRNWLRLGLEARESE